jgi:drug/metabolite transporter (DMT)-like permease
LGFFFWNKGAVKVNSGSLAVFNNLKIPFGILIAIILFSEKVNFISFIVGGLIITFALSINEWLIKNNNSERRISNE